MQLLMIIVDTECREELEVLLQRNGVTGYSEIPNAHGVGITGVRMGSGAHPKTSSIFFTVVEADKVDELKKTLRSYCDYLFIILVVVGWFVLQRVVLPRLGVPT
jgi:hypothetical protein